MNSKTYQKLGRAIAACCRACGTPPSAVKSLAPGVISIEGSGITVLWSSEAHRGRPGWVIRETYEVSDGAGGWRPQTATIASTPEDEWVRAAKCAVVLMTERQVDAVLEDLVQKDS